MDIPIDTLQFLTKIKRKFLKIDYPDIYKYITKKLSESGYFVRAYSRGTFLFSNKKISFWVSSEYPWIAFEVFCDEIYKFHSKLEKGEKYTVLDIGANRGYASLYFAAQDWCEAVYAFELIPVNYQLAQKNRSENSFRIKKKIRIFNYGLAKKSKTTYANFVPHRDGISSLSKKFLNSFAPEERNNVIQTPCTVRKSSEVLKELVHSVEKLIMKIDVEGAEYEIIRELTSSYPEVFERIDIIIGETHLGFQKFKSIVSPFGFTVVHREILKNGNCQFELRRGV